MSLGDIALGYAARESLDPDARLLRAIGNSAIFLMSKFVEIEFYAIYHRTGTLKSAGDLIRGHIRFHHLQQPALFLL